MLSAISKYSIQKAISTNEPLFVCSLYNYLTKERRTEILCSSLYGIRITLCGGNPGMGYPSQFFGNPKGFWVDIDGKGYQVLNAKEFDQCLTIPQG